MIVVREGHPGSKQFAILFGAFRFNEQYQQLKGAHSYTFGGPCSSKVYQRVRTVVPPGHPPPTTIFQQKRKATLTKVQTNAHTHTHTTTTTTTTTRLQTWTDTVHEVPVFKGY
jgi:hypothetical protein